MIQLGDFVAQIHASNGMHLKKGIVVKSYKDSFIVHWLTYNKKFWMESNGEEFAELNRRYLLTQMSYSRYNTEVDILILSKAGENGVGNS